jgi:hypothetical protein
VFKDKRIAIPLDNIHIKVITPVEFESGLSSESVILNEESAFFANVTNNDVSGSLDISELAITIPSALKVTEKSRELVQSGNTFIAKDTVDAKDSKSYYIKVKTMEKGAYNISSTLKSSIHEKSFDTQVSGMLRVGLADISPTILITPQSAIAGESVDVLVVIKNTGSRSISSFDLDLTSNLITGQHLVNESVGVGESQTIYSKSVKIPMIEKDTDYFVRVTGYHKNLAGSMMNFEAQKSLSAFPQEKIVDISQETYAEGKNLKVIVKVKSVKEDISDIDIVDMPPKGMSVTGTRDAHLDELKKGEERAVLNYSILIPLTYSSDSVSVNRVFTAKRADGKSYSSEKEVSVKINAAVPIGSEEEPAKEDESATANASASSAVPDKTRAEEPAPKNGQSFFQRMISGFKGFFAGLFLA